MEIFIDKDLKCHLTNEDTEQSVETDAFDGKCQEYIEGYRFVPEGKQWTRGDGKIFEGEMIAPWMEHSQLELAQSAYERGLVQADETIAAMIDEIYSMDMEEIENV